MPLEETASNGRRLRRFIVIGGSITLTVAVICLVSVWDANETILEYSEEGAVGEYPDYRSEGAYQERVHFPEQQQVETEWQESSGIDLEQSEGKQLRRELSIFLRDTSSAEPAVEDGFQNEFAPKARAFQTFQTPLPSDVMLETQATAKAKAAATSQVTRGKYFDDFTFDGDGKIGDPAMDASNGHDVGDLSFLKTNVAPPGRGIGGDAMHLANKAAKAHLAAMKGVKKKRATRVQQSIDRATYDYEAEQHAFQHRGEGIFKAAIDAQVAKRTAKSRREYGQTPRGPPKSDVNAGVAGMVKRAGAVPRARPQAHPLVVSRNDDKSKKHVVAAAPQAQSAIPMPAAAVPSHSEKDLKDPAFKHGDPLFKAPLKDPAFVKRQTPLKAMTAEQSEIAASKAMTPQQLEIAASIAIARKAMEHHSKRKHAMAVAKAHAVVLKAHAVVHERARKVREKARSRHKAARVAAILARKDAKVANARKEATFKAKIKIRTITHNPYQSKKNPFHGIPKRFRPGYKPPKKKKTGIKPPHPHVAIAMKAMAAMRAKQRHHAKANLRAEVFGTMKARHHSKQPMEHLLGGAPNTEIAREAMEETKLKVATPVMKPVVKVMKPVLKVAQPVVKVAQPVVKVAQPVVKKHHSKAFKKGIMKAAAAAVAFHNSFKKAAKPRSIVDAIVSEEERAPAGMATSLLGDKKKVKKKMTKKVKTKVKTKVQPNKLLSFVPIKPKVKTRTKKVSAAPHHLWGHRRGYQAIINKLEAKLKKQHTKNEKLVEEVKEDHKAEKKDHHKALPTLRLPTTAPGKKKKPVMLSSILSITE